MTIKDKILSVWHQGEQNCALPCKNETYQEKEEKKNILREIVNKNPRSPIAKLIDQESQFYMERGEFDNAQKFVSSCTDRKILNQIRKEAFDDMMSHDMHSLAAVGIVKKNLMPLISTTYIKSMIEHSTVSHLMCSKVQKLLVK